ncbi:MAG: phosphatase PAP2 family protein [Planctomycetota bacterium]
MQEKPKKRFRNIVFIALGLLALSLISVFMDVEITRHRRTEVMPGDLRRIITLSEIFAHGFGIAVIFYAIWVLAPGKRWFLPRLASCAILPGIVVQCFKLFIARYRPGHFFPDYADHVAQTWIGFYPDGQLNMEYVTQSFPSAHAATAVGLATGLVWLFPQCRGLIIFLAGLASFQRVVAGAHWTSDVFAGAAISVLICGLVFRLNKIDTFFASLESRALGDTSLKLVDSSENEEDLKTAA